MKKYLTLLFKIITGIFLMYHAVLVGTGLVVFMIASEDKEANFYGWFSIIFILLLVPAHKKIEYFYFGNNDDSSK